MDIRSHNPFESALPPEYGVDIQMRLGTIAAAEANVDRAIPDTGEDL